jgi:hypothetical protein
MDINIRQVELNKPLGTQVIRRERFGLSRFRGEINRLQIRIADMDRPKVVPIDTVSRRPSRAPLRNHGSRGRVWPSFNFQWLCCSYEPGRRLRAEETQEHTDQGKSPQVGQFG